MNNNLCFFIKIFKVVKCGFKIVWDGFLLWDQDWKVIFKGFFGLIKIMEKILIFFWDFY